MTHILESDCRTPAIVLSLRSVIVLKEFDNVTSENPRPKKLAFDTDNSDNAKYLNGTTHLVSYVTSVNYRLLSAIALVAYPPISIPIYLLPGFVISFGVVLYLSEANQ